jgi:hypothetical protein
MLKINYCVDYLSAHTLYTRTLTTHLFLCQYGPDSASLVTSIPEATVLSISLRDGRPAVISLEALTARGKAASSLWVQSIRGS